LLLAIERGAVSNGEEHFLSLAFVEGDVQGDELRAAIGAYLTSGSASRFPMKSTLSMVPLRRVK
jgi:hypothetical protein